MTNFIISAPLIWFMEMCYFGNILSSCHMTAFKYNRLMILSLVFLTIHILQRELTVIKAQSQLTNVEQAKRKDISKLKALSPSIETSERYYTLVGEAFFRIKQYKKAEKYFVEALKFTSSPYVYKRLSDCHGKAGNKEKCIECLEAISYIKPHHLWPKVLLMRRSDHFGDTTSALHYATSILNTPLKIPSKTASAYRYEAIMYMRSHHINSK